MYDIDATDTFRAWHAQLRDRAAYARISVQIRRMSQGLIADAKPVGDGVSEIRLHFGPGYRLYFCRQGARILLLLAGGDKSSQAADIRTAIKLKADSGSVA